MTKKKTPKMEADIQADPTNPPLAPAQPEPEASAKPEPAGPGDAAPAQPAPPQTVTMEDLILAMDKMVTQINRQGEYITNLANDHNRLKEQLAAKPPEGGGSIAMVLMNPEVQGILKGLAQSFIGGGEKPKDGLESLIGEELTAEFRATLKQAVKDKYSLLTAAAEDLKAGRAKVVQNE